jgi:hypothetical protein
MNHTTSEPVDNPLTKVKTLAAAAYVTVDQTLFDVTDKSRYTFRKRSEVAHAGLGAELSAIDRFMSEVSTSEFHALLTQVPVLGKVLESIIGKPELVARMSKRSQQLVDAGKAYLVKAANGDGLRANV